MTGWSEEEIILYKSQFNHLNGLIGKTIESVYMYLEMTDVCFSEQPNIYGKSLFNGIDLFIDNQSYSIGNRFSDQSYGLCIDKGMTKDFELIEKEKNRQLYSSLSCKGQVVIDANIYWAKIPWENSRGFYPQEIEIKTENGYILLSSIEINRGEVNIEFTDEILIVEDEVLAKELGLGAYGVRNSGRELFDDFCALRKKHITTWL